jgi:hypothetical protein
MCSALVSFLALVLLLCLHHRRSLGSTEVDFDYDESVRAGAMIRRCRMDS